MQKALLSKKLFVCLNGCPPDGKEVGAGDVASKGADGDDVKEVGAGVVASESESDHEFERTMAWFRFKVTCSQNPAHLKATMDLARDFVVAWKSQHLDPEA